MKHNIPCPSFDELKRLLNDDESLANRDSLSAHVQSCTDCQSAMEGLTRNDDLRIDASGSLKSNENASSALQEMQRRLKRSEPRFFPRDSHPTLADQSSGSTLEGESPSVQALPDQRIGKYEVVKELGAGASGVVYQALDTELNRIVAIKMLRRQMVEADDSANRLRREARSVASLSHPNILSLHEIGQQEDGRPFLVFEFVDGESLGQILSDNKILAPKKTAELIREVATGLAAAHEAGLIHRDIKPSNIIVKAKSGQPKIVDFGLAIDDEFESKLTQQGMIAGTPAYMSPEQVQPESHIDHRTDIYSLGIVLYECLTGDVPFRGVVKSTLNRIVNEPPADPKKLNPSVRQDLATISLKAISKDPRRRYQSAEAMASDLGRWLENKPILARPVSRLERSTNWCKRNPLAASLVSLVAVLATILVVGSLTTASKMAAANREVMQTNTQLEQKSAAVARQRDVLLKSMQDLVYRINDSMERDFDVDKTQKELLRIAITGLKTVSREANDNLSNQIAADAHLRLANVLYRLDDNGAASRQLDLARNINEKLRTDFPKKTDAQLLATRIRWLQASLDAESEESESSIENFERAWVDTQEWIDKRETDDGLLLDAIYGLAQLGDIRFDQNELDKSRHCRETMVDYADILLANDNPDSLSNINTNIIVWTLKIDAWESIAEMAWAANDRVATGKHDLLSEYHSVLIGAFADVLVCGHVADDQSVDGEVVASHLLERIQSLKSQDHLAASGRLELAEYEAMLRETYLAANKLDQALSIGRSCVDIMKTLATDADLTSNFLLEMTNDGGRLAMILIRLGKHDEAMKELVATRQFVKKVSTKIEFDAQELDRWQARLDYIESTIDTDK